MPSYLDDIIRTDNAGESPLDDVRTSDESRLDQGFAERDEDAASRFGVDDAHSAAVSARLEDGDSVEAEGAGAGFGEGAPAPVEGTAQHASKLAAASRAQAVASEAAGVADFDEDADDLGDEATGEAQTARRAVRRARRGARPSERAVQAQGGNADAAAEDAVDAAARPRPPKAASGVAKGSTATSGASGAAKGSSGAAAGAADAEKARETAHEAARARGVVATRAATGAEAAAGPLGSNAHLSAHLRNFFRAIKAKGAIAQAGIAAKAATVKQIVVAGGAKGALAALAPVAAVLLLALALCLGIGSCSGLFGGILDETTTGYDINLSGNELVVAEFLLGYGLDETHVAAIMANMRAESGGEVGEDFDTGSIEAGSGAGHGLCQWTGGRWNGPGGLLAFANRQGKPWTDIYVQLDFFWQEYSSPWSGSYTITSGDSPPPGTHVRGSKSGFEGASELHEATRQICYGWERPGIPHESKRLAFADAYFGLLTGGGEYVGLALSIAADDSHGYSLGKQGPDEFDCQGLVKYCLAQSGYDSSLWGFDSLGTGTGAAREGLKAMGFTEHVYTGHDGVPAGAVMLYHFAGTASGHVAFHVGDGRIVEAISDYDGRPGDGSGQEIRVGPDWAAGLWQYYYTPPR